MYILYIILICILINYFSLIYISILICTFELYIIFMWIWMIKYLSLEECTIRFSDFIQATVISPLKTIYQPFNIEPTLLTLPNRIGKVRLIGLSVAAARQILLKNIFLQKRSKYSSLCITNVWNNENKMYVYTGSLARYTDNTVRQRLRLDQK